MVGVRTFIAAGAVALISSAAAAADMPMPQVPQIPMQPIPLIVQQPVGGWYLRGYVGVGDIGNTSVTYLPNALNAPNNFAFQDESMGDTTFFGAGIGYEWNNWLRFDFTAEYRTKTDIDAFGTYTYNGSFADSYHAFLSSDIFLANAYIDLGTWDCITPFVGAGIGGAYNMLSNFVDLGVGTSGAGVGPFAGAWSPAWALYVGLAYNVTPSFTVDLTYRYLNYGSITDSINCIGGCNPDSYKFGNLSSQDLMLGIRWRLQFDSAPAVFAPQPVFAQQPVYAPQPMYTPQPLYTPSPQFLPQPQYMPQPQYAPVPQPPLQSRG